MGKFIDLTGQKFGRLTVISRSPENKNGRPAWICECECGNRKNISGQSLRSGKTTSCGCLGLEKLYEYSSQIFEDLTGQSFGYLTVLEQSPTINKKTMWKCQCQCGNILNVRSDSLKSGHTRSCGCYHNEVIKESKKEKNHIDYSGQKFGKLTVIKEMGNDNKGFFSWLCKCDCGNIIITREASLLSGNTKSCGCLKSHGEEKVSKLLKENNILFEVQKTYDDCRFLDTKCLAKFDFYIPSKNYLIEFDGVQHFSYSATGWNTKEKFEKTQQHDLFKNNYCISKNIPLIRIPYTKLNTLQIEDLLLETSDFLINKKKDS